MKIIVTKQIIDQMKDLFEEYLDVNLEMPAVLSQEAEKDIKLVEVRKKILNSEAKLKVFREIVFSNGITQKLLTTKLAVAKSNMSGYISELEALELVTKGKRGLIVTQFGMRFYKEIKNLDITQQKPEDKEQETEQPSDKAEQLMNEWFKMTESKPFKQEDFLKALESNLELTKSQAKERLDNLLSKDKATLLENGDLTK